MGTYYIRLLILGLFFPQLCFAMGCSSLVCASNTLKRKWRLPWVLEEREEKGSGEKKQC